MDTESKEVITHWITGAIAFLGFVLGVADGGLVNGLFIGVIFYFLGLFVGAVAASLVVLFYNGPFGLDGPKGGGSV